MITTFDHDHNSNIVFAIVIRDPGFQQHSVNNVAYVAIDLF